MSVGPMGMIGAAAGTNLAKTTGSDIQRTQQDASSQARQTQADQKAENAAGIGETEEDQGTSERDADGRRLWEARPEGERAQDEDQRQQEAASDPPRSKDPTGQSGNELDLSG